MTFRSSGTAQKGAGYLNVERLGSSAPVVGYGSFPAAAELKTGRPEWFSASLGPSSLHRPVEW